MSVLDDFYVSIEFWGGIMGFVLSIVLGTIYFKWDRSNKSFIIIAIMFLSVGVAIFSDSIGWAVDGVNPELSMMTTVITFVGHYVTIIAFMYMVEYFAYDKVSNKPFENVTRFKNFAIAICLTEMIVVLILVAMGKSEIFFYYDSEGFYHRGKYFLLTQVPVFATVIAALPLLIKHKDRIPREIYWTLAAFAILGVTGEALNSITESPIRNIFYTASLFFITSGLLMYSYYIRVENNKRLFKMEQELTELQVQPHFLYNTLNTIYYLCKRDPEAAQQAIVDFSDYLRENLEEIKSSDLISFEKEITHVEHYLSLQKLRYADRLDVTWEIIDEDFMIPPLTVQTLVENSIKYGSSVVCVDKKN